MKTAKRLLTLPATWMSMQVAQAKGEIFYTVPFSNVEIKAASKIYVHYNFDPRTQTLICKTAPNHGLMSSIKWSYKDVARKLELPVILKNNDRFDGYFADPEGLLAITNDFGPDSIYVTCEYRSLD